MESKLRELLDNTYELEGLIHLALKRDDSIEDFIRLISKKGKEIALCCENIKKENAPVENNPQPFSLDFMEEYSIEDELKNSTSDSYELGEEEKSDSQENYDSMAVISDEIKGNPRGKLVFSINERFRFRRELFGNSDADFNNTLALVASMDNYEEAEDYFLNEEGFEISNPVVKEFMDVIKRYFK